MSSELWEGYGGPNIVPQTLTALLTAAADQGGTWTVLDNTVVAPPAILEQARSQGLLKVWHETGSGVTTSYILTKSGWAFLGREPQPSFLLQILKNLAGYMPTKR